MSLPTRTSGLLLLILPVLVVPLVLWVRHLRSAATPPVGTPWTPPSNLYHEDFDATNVSAFMPAPDGKVVLTAGDHSYPSAFRAWDARNGKLLRRFGKYGLHNSDAVLSPNGKLIGFSQGAGILILDAGAGRQKLVIPKPRVQNRSPRWLQDSGFALSDDVLVVPAGGDVRWYDVRSGRHLRSMKQRLNLLRAWQPRFSREGRLLLWIATTGRGNEWHANGSLPDEIVWTDGKTGRRLGSFTVPHAQWQRATFSGDGRVILAFASIHHWTKDVREAQVVASDPYFFAIDVATGKQLYSWKIEQNSNSDMLPVVYESTFQRIAVSPDGKWFALSRHVATDDEIPPPPSLSIFEVRTGRVVHTLKPELGIPYRPAWSPDSRMLYVLDYRVRRLQLQKDGRWKLS